MDKYTFDKLDIKEKVAFVNSKTEKGIRVDVVATEIGIGGRKLRDQLRNSNYKFDKKSKIYVLEERKEENNSNNQDEETIDTTNIDEKLDVLTKDIRKITQHSYLSKNLEILQQCKENAQRMIQILDNNIENIQIISSMEDDELVI